MSDNSIRTTLRPGDEVTIKARKGRGQRTVLVIHHDADVEIELHPRPKAIDIDSEKADTAKS